MGLVVGYLGQCDPSRFFVDRAVVPRIHADVHRVYRMDLPKSGALWIGLGSPGADAVSRVEHELSGEAKQVLIVLGKTLCHPGGGAEVGSYLRNRAGAVVVVVAVL